jgi:hypothetical protein
MRVGPRTPEAYRFLLSATTVTCVSCARRSTCDTRLRIGNSLKVRERERVRKICVI